MKVKKSRTYYAIHISDGECEWNNYKQIEEWAEQNGYEHFRKGGKLFLISKEEVIIYEK